MWAPWPKNELELAGGTRDCKRRREGAHLPPRRTGEERERERASVRRQVKQHHTQSSAADLIRPAGASGCAAHAREEEERKQDGLGRHVGAGVGSAAGCESPAWLFAATQPIPSLV